MNFSADRSTPSLGAPDGLDAASNDQVDTQLTGRSTRT